MIRNKIKYIILLTAIGLLAILYNRYIMGIIFLSMLAMPFLLFGILSYTYGKTKVELLSYVHVAHKGELISVSIHLNNPTIFPISNLTIYLIYKNLYSNKKIKKDVSLTLDRKTSTTAICNVLSEYAGNLEVTLKGIRVYDYLQLFSLRRKLGGKIKVAVLPDFHEIIEKEIIHPYKGMIESDYYSQIKSGDDSSEVFSIREYREGDRLQRIHWKLSAKQDQLMIKEFSDPINCSVLIFIDLGIPQGEDVLIYMDALLECAFSISYSLVMKGHTHYIAWFDETMGACRRTRITCEKDLFEALDGLLQTTPNEKEEPLKVYMSEYFNDRYTDFFYVNWYISMSQLDTLDMMKAYKKHMIYVLEEKQFVPKEFVNKSTKMGIGLSVVDIMNLKEDIENLTYKEIPVPVK